MATSKPVCVVINASEMPPAMALAFPVPNTANTSKVAIMPVTVPSKPSSGATLLIVASCVSLVGCSQPAESNSPAESTGPAPNVTSTNPVPQQFAGVPASTPQEAVSAFFAAFRDGEEAGLDVIVVEAVPEIGVGRAVMDRLRRASA